jgi:serine/threonine protein phosphatase 1
MESYFKRIPRNLVGRDFVTGDIHGAYDTVKAAMRRVGFNVKVDRLFPVGDLTDRGGDSARVVEFLDLPCVFSIRGNHDHDFLALDPEERQILASINDNGMGWIKDTPAIRLQQVQHALSKLPIAMEIETERGSVCLVHGDVPAGMDWPTFVSRIQAGDEEVINVALTGRDRIQDRNDDGVAGIDRVFVGHTIQWAGPRRLGNVYAIDTGSIFAELEKDKGSLTMVNMAFASGMLPSRSDTNMNIEAGQGEGPFGNYVVQRPRQ